MLSVFGHGFTMIDHVDQATSSWTSFHGDRKPNLRGRRAPETPGLFTCAAHHFLDRPAPHALWPAKAQKKVGEPTISRQQMGFSYGFHGDIRIYIYIYIYIYNMGYIEYVWKWGIPPSSDKKSMEKPDDNPWIWGHPIRMTTRWRWESQWISSNELRWIAASLLEKTTGKTYWHKDPGDPGLWSGSKPWVLRWFNLLSISNSCDKLDKPNKQH